MMKVQVFYVHLPIDFLIVTVVFQRDRKHPTFVKFSEGRWFWRTWFVQSTSWRFRNDRIFLCQKRGYAKLHILHLSFQHYHFICMRHLQSLNSEGWNNPWLPLFVSWYIFANLRPEFTFVYHADTLFPVRLSKSNYTLNILFGCYKKTRTDQHTWFVRQT